MTFLPKLFGGLGVVLISLGVIIKYRKTQDIFYILGGVCLETYSLFIGDIIFVLLQIIFIVSAVFDLYKIKYKKA